jgi:hypothetical protein
LAKGAKPTSLGSLVFIAEYSSSSWAVVSFFAFFGAGFLDNPAIPSFSYLFKLLYTVFSLQFTILAVSFMLYPSKTNRMLCIFNARILFFALRSFSFSICISSDVPCLFTIASAPCFLLSLADFFAL